LPIAIEAYESGKSNNTTKLIKLINQEIEKEGQVPEVKNQPAIIKNVALD
jgi:hypothetical protein